MSQNHRIDVIDDTVDFWDDRIVSPETINIDTQERLSDLEGIIFGKNAKST